MESRLPPAQIAQNSLRLTKTANGNLPADLVLRRGIWVCVQSGEIVADSDLAILDGRVAYIGPDASHTIGPATEVVDAHGLYFVPGLLDGHMHVESGMVTVTEFVRAVVPHGTTGMFIDPHEMANVFGLAGVRLMVAEAAEQPIHVWVEMPSCVPSAPGLETPGASISPEEVGEAMTWPGIIGLGEMMNFPGVIGGDLKLHAEMAETRSAGKVIGGHFAASVGDRSFHAYAAGGPQDDHEGITTADAIARVRQGMRAMLRLGSAWHDVAEQIKAVSEAGLDPRHFILCTDDSHSQTLVEDGHMDRVVRHAIQQGIKPITAIQMATLNTAEHFGVADRVGQIAPGRWADFLLVSNLAELKIVAVYGRGRRLAEAGRLLIDLPAYPYPPWALDTIHIGKKFTARDFQLAAPASKSNGANGEKFLANIIGVIENQAPTRRLRIEVDAVQGEIHPDPQRDLAKIAIVERHRATGRVQVGLIHGFGLSEKCAVATSIAHDCHHLIVVGTDEDQMAMAVNTIAEVKGGQVVVQDGQVIGLVELPIGGLMSNERAEVVAAKAGTVLRGFERCGCRMQNANMQLSLLALAVIPELRLSDLGLVDVGRFELIPILEPLPEDTPQ